MQFYQLVSWKGHLWCRIYKKKRMELSRRPATGEFPLKVGSKLPICALWVSAKLFLCSPFQGTPGVLASIGCSQNALRCHLFKHSEPLANRDKPLFIKPLILAARMTTWLALKGALKSFIEMGGGNLYRVRKAHFAEELCQMNTRVRWGTLLSKGLMGHPDCNMWQRQPVDKEAERESIWLGTMGEKYKEGVNGNKSNHEWRVVAEIGGPDESTSGWDHERMSNEWVRVLWSRRGLSKWTNC